MNAAHLLPLSDLHAAAPGVLSVVFGPDGDFDGAPEWRPPLYMMVGGRFVSDWLRTDDVIWLPVPPHGRVAHGQVALDLRVPSVAARLVGLCVRASDPKHPVPFSLDALAAVGSGQIPPRLAEHLASMTLALAPQIAALGGGR